MRASAAAMAASALAAHDHAMSPTDDPTPEEATEPRAPSAILESDLLRSRTVLVFGEVTTELAHRTCASLFALAARGDDPIRVVVHSQGGHVEAADTIHDVIRFIRPDVVMIGTGWVASAGALIYCAAEKRNRLALPNTRFLLHQPLGGMRGPASDVEIEAAQILRMRDRLNAIFAKATGLPARKIAEDTDRNHWLGAEEAKAYGLVERIVERQDAV